MASTASYAASTTPSAFPRPTISSYGLSSQAPYSAVRTPHISPNSPIPVSNSRIVVLARFPYLNFSGTFCPATSQGGNGAAPGECYYYTSFSQYKIGILLHLSCVLPSGLLAVVQFIPVIRHKWILVHRLNGYIILLLFTLSTVGALMIARHAFGGGLDIQAAIGALSIMCMGSFVLSYVNIKRLQIEQHRAWMLRGWFYVRFLVWSGGESANRVRLVLSSLREL